MKLLLILVLVPLVYGTGLLGGYRDADPKNPEFAKIVNFALGEVNRAENSERNLEEIVSAKTQLVAGVNYKFVLRVKNGDQDELCDVTVYDIPWMNETTLTKHECKATYQNKLGGEKTATVDEIHKALVAATDYHNLGLNSLYLDRVQSVENVKKQTVAGTLFTFTVNFIPTKCVKDGNRQRQGLQGCAPTDSGTVKRCTFKVLFQSWMKDQYTVTSEKCDEQKPPSGSVTKLKDLPHDKPRLEELFPPGDTLPVLPSSRNSKAPLRQKKSVNGFQPLMQDIGKSVIEALKDAKKDHTDFADKKNPDFDKLLGKDGHDLVQHGLDKLFKGEGHELLKQGIEQLLGGDDHDLKKHGLDELLGADGHDLVEHGLGELLGGDGHDLQKHGFDKLIGRDDHDMKKHGGLIGGDDHDMKKHGSLIGGDDHDMKKHGSLIGGDDHDMKKHGSLIGGDDHDMKKHGSLIGGDDHDLCHLGHFKEFIIRHGKVYDTVDEENKRFGIFCENMAFARKLNKTEQGSAVYGATKFADLTHEEFRQKYLSKRNWNDIPNHSASKMWRAKIPKVVAPKAFDWREHGAVTNVKNQGQCGSCWAFSTTGNIEGQWKIKRGSLVSLSEQELVDCDKLDSGCEGGLPSNAYESIMKLGGLETENEYKYEGEDDKCVFNKSEVVVTINGAVNISSNEDDMATWLAMNGPISIGINAMAMQFYFGGISHPWKIFCNPSELDHGVLIVGYGVEGTEPYWIIKNSWGVDWGEKGYYLVYRGDGVCGLNTMCTSAVVD